MSGIDRPVWEAAYGNVWRAEWHGMYLIATEHWWELYKHGVRLTQGVWRQQRGQRPASAAVRLRENQDRCFNAAWRRVSDAT